MAKKDDMAKLMQREARRRTSIVGSIAGLDTPLPEPVPALTKAEQVPAIPEKTQAEKDDSNVPRIKSVIRPDKKETRTERKQIVLTPSLDRRVTQRCRTEKLSLNEVVNQLLQNWVDMEDA